MTRGGRLLPPCLKIWKYQDCSASNQAKFEQNQNFSGSAENLSRKSEFLGSHKDIFGKTKFFVA